MVYLWVLCHWHRILCDGVSANLTSSAQANIFKTSPQIDCPPTAESRFSCYYGWHWLWPADARLTASSANTVPAQTNSTDSGSFSWRTKGQRTLSPCIVWSLIHLPLNYVTAIQLVLFLCRIGKKILLKLLGIVEIVALAAPITEELPRLVLSNVRVRQKHIQILRIHWHQIIGAF